MIRHCKTWNIIRHCKTWSNNIKHYKHSQFPISGGFPLGKSAVDPDETTFVIPSCWLTIPIDHISLDLPITANQLLNQLWHPKTWDTSTQKLEMMVFNKKMPSYNSFWIFYGFLWFIAFSSHFFHNFWTPGFHRSAKRRLAFSIAWSWRCFRASSSWVSTDGGKQLEALTILTPVVHSG